MFVKILENEEIHFINTDPKRIAECGHSNMIDFIATKTQYSTFTLKTSSTLTNITLNGTDIPSISLRSVRFE